MDISNGLIVQILRTDEFINEPINRGTPTEIDTFRWFYDHQAGKKVLDTYEKRVNALWSRYEALVNDMLVDHKTDDKNRILFHTIPKIASTLRTLVPKWHETNAYTVLDKIDGPDANKLKKWINKINGLKEAIAAYNEIFYTIRMGQGKAKNAIADALNNMSEEERNIYRRMGFPKKYVETVNYEAHSCNDRIGTYCFIHYWKDRLDEIEKLRKKITDANPKTLPAIEAMINIEKPLFKRYVDDNTRLRERTDKEKNIFLNVIGAKRLAFILEEMARTVFDITTDHYEYDDVNGWHDLSADQIEYQDVDIL